MLERLRLLFSDKRNPDAVNPAETSRSADKDNYWLKQIDSARQEALPEHFLEYKEIITDRICVGSGKNPFSDDVGVGYITSRFMAVVVECPNQDCFAEFVWTGKKTVPLGEFEQQIKEIK